MGIISTNIMPAAYGELDLIHVAAVTVDESGVITAVGGVGTPGYAVAPRPGVPGTLVKVRDKLTGADLADTALNEAGYIPEYDTGASILIVFSTDNWVTEIGPFLTREGLIDLVQTGTSLPPVVLRSMLTGKGDLPVGTGAVDASNVAEVTRLGAGTTGYVLTSDPAAATGLVWGPPPKDSYQLWLDAGNTGSLTDYFNSLKVVGPAGPSGVAPASFAQPGNLVVGTGKGRFYNDTGQTLTITYVRATVGTAPASVAVRVDVNRDGTTIFTTQANRPSITPGAFTAKVTNMDVTTLAAGSYLSVDVDQTGTPTTPGSDLSVFVGLTV